MQSRQPTAPSVGRRLVSIIWPFVAIVAMMVVLAYVSVDMLSAARAFIGGESLWSRAQKRAVYHLNRYARTGFEYEYQLFEQAMEVPLGDREGRLELERPDPDLHKAARAFIQGGNHPEDVPGMIRLYLRFRHEGHVKHALAIWARADEEMVELQRVAQQIREHVAAQSSDGVWLDHLMHRVHAIDQRLTPIEEGFSATMGLASRHAQMLLMLAILVTAGALTVVGVALARRMLVKSEAAEAQLHAEKERAQVTLASIGDAVITTDSMGRVEYLNPVAESLTGRGADSVRGQPLASVCRFIEDGTRRPLPDPVEMALREGCATQLAANVLLVRADGSEVAIDESAAPIRARDGAICGLVLVLRDISRERAYAAQLSHQAAHDPLTGLINRREFERRIDTALASARARQRSHAVMYLDLDQFKVVNDTCGHAAGDELLRQVSALLQARLRDGDALARLGGDEFGVLLENCPPEHALRIADELRQTVVDFRFAAQGLSFPIGVSIGLVNLDHETINFADVLSAADSACYLAKENGRNRVQLYHPGDGELSVRRGMMQWVARIHEAIEEGRLRLYAQPIAGTRNPLGPHRHIELLLRMIDRDGLLIPPMAFLPAAERYNLMPVIDRWVVRTAFETLARASDPWPGSCAINLSGATLCDERFLDYVCEQYRLFGIAPSSICFEITETVAIANLGKASRFIEELRRLGFRFSLDDFGTGMSSFAYLKQLPVDFLKIDGSFVKDMLVDPIDCAMVEAINNIGHVMGMKTIAEFVENDQVLARLREIGVDYAQGYGIARPVPFDSLHEEAPSAAANSERFLAADGRAA